MERLFQDIKHSFRGFRLNPAFTFTVVAVLALGIGVNTAIFSVVNAVLLKPLPFPDPDRLVFVLNSNAGAPTAPNTSPAKFMHYRAQTEVLEDVTAIRTVPLNYAAGDIPEQVNAATVSDPFFRVLGAPFAAGRGFAPGDDLPGAPSTVVLSYSFWQQYFGGNPDAVGETISLSGNSHTVVGIAGSNFDVREFGEIDLWVPFTLDPNTTDQGHYFQTIARLKDGVTLEQAQARLEASAAGYRERFPIALGENGGFSALTMQDTIVRNARGRLFTLFGAVALVLLVACANVANLLLLRATGRQREIAIRSAIGAGRWRIVRQLLTESVMLAMTGGVLGLIGGYIGMRALLSVGTAGLPRLDSAGDLLGLDWRVVVFTLGLSLLTGLLFGLMPALVSARTDLNSVIKDTSNRSGGSFRQNKTRSALVVLEVALAIVLVIGTGLLIRTTVALNAVDPGFSVDNVIAMRTSFSDPRFASTEATAQMQANVREQLLAVPGVEAAVATCCVPLQGGYGLPFNILGRQDEGPFTGGGGILPASPGYFETFEIPVLAGRVFNERDDQAGPPVVVINQAMVDQFWADGGDPLEDRILIGGGAGNMQELAEEPVRQIIGVVDSVRAGGLQNEPGPVMYMPQAQLPDALNAFMQASGPVAWIIRTRTEPASSSTMLQETVRQATGLPVAGVQLMEEVVSLATSQQRVNMLLMTVFGVAALVLAAIGIYGLMAYSVQQRTQEIGIRMALGADARRIKVMVIRQGMWLVLIGVGIGLVVAFFLANVLASILFGVEPRDVAVFVTVPVCLTLIALVAVALPAHRASGVDPVSGVRYE